MMVMVVMIVVILVLTRMGVMNAVAGIPGVILPCGVHCLYRFACEACLVVTPVWHTEHPRKTPTVGLEPTTTRLRALRSAD